MSTTDPGAKITGLFESMRDYVHALERNGHLLRIAEMDQDAYESTGFAYRLMDLIGFNYAPAFVVEHMTLRGRRYDTPVVGNVYGPLISEAMGLGVENLSDDHDAMYEATMPRTVSTSASLPKSSTRRGASGTIARVKPAPVTKTWHRRSSVTEFHP